jgi:uncharacterized protein
VASRSAYLDASALVKLILTEPETSALRRHLRAGHRKVTNEIAVIEVTRAAGLADPSPQTRAETRRLLEETDLVQIDRDLIHDAAGLASQRLRTLDALHLATALRAQPGELVAYDQRLLDAAAEAGLTVASPT